MYVAIAFVAVLMISNTVAVKLITIWGFTFTGAIFIFPVSYIFGDILTEVYGYKESRKIIWAGFFALVFMSICYYFVQVLPASPFWPGQSYYETILGLVPRIVFASIVGYFIGEFVNSYVLSKMKIITKGKHMWSRFVGSTIVGQFFDTIFFVTIGFYGIVPNMVLPNLIFSGYIAKVLVEIVLIPVSYIVVHKLKKLEGIDTFDHGVNYNPFHFK